MPLYIATFIKTNNARLYNCEKYYVKKRNCDELNGSYRLAFQ